MGWGGGLGVWGEGRKGGSRRKKRVGKGPVVRGSEASVGTGQCAGREGRDQDI